MVVGSILIAITQMLDTVHVLSKELLDIQATEESILALKSVCDMKRTHS